MSEPTRIPQVHLVGASPGDPVLVAVKAQCVIGDTEILVRECLAGSEIVALAPAPVRKIRGRESDGFHPVPQGPINAALVGLPGPGHTLIRLKGGDPFLSGRVVSLVRSRFGRSTMRIDGRSASVAGEAGHA